MAKKKIKKGRVFVHTSKGVFPYELIKKEEKTSSKQLAEVQQWMTDNDLVPVPYSPNALFVLYESNTTFWSCVNQLASDVAGLGWKLQLKKDQKDNDVELKRINEFLNRPNPDDEFRSILKGLLIDWGVIGWFGIEVARNNKGDIGEIYHVPAHTLRVHKSKTKFCQSRNDKKVWFKKFGETVDISSKDGKESTGRHKKDKANELIYCKNYYPKSDYYGVPNVISAIGDVVGLIGLRDYNLAFFENYGIPAALITLEGEWEEGSDKKVSDFLNKEIKGTDNAHRTMVIMTGESGKEGSNTFKYQKLGVEVKEGSFRLYEQGRKEDVMMAYSMPPERIGVQRKVGSLGGNVAEEATKIYIQSVVEPLQLDLEGIINNKLLQSEIYEFKFNNIDLRDYDKLVDRLIKQVATAIKTPNEARNELGLKPYTGGDKFFVGSSLIPAGEIDDDMKLAKEIEDLITKG